MQRFVFAVLTLALGTSAACGGDDDEGNSTGGTTATGGGGAGGTTATGGGGAGGTTASGGAAGCGAEITASCDQPAQNLCDDYAHACPILQEVQEACTNKSGTYASPAACPTGGFVGKCTLPASRDGSQLTTRYYTGADASAMQSFCETTAGGAWSTAF